MAVKLQVTKHHKQKNVAAVYCIQHLLIVDISLMRLHWVRLFGCLAPRKLYRLLIVIWPGLEISPQRIAPNSWEQLC